MRFTPSNAFDENQRVRLFGIPIVVVRIIAESAHLLIRAVEIATIGKSDRVFRPRLESEIGQFVLLY